MATRAGCAQPLRVIGRALEDLDIADFDLESDGVDFVVRGQANAPKKSLSGGVQEARVRTVWRMLRHRYLGGKSASRELSESSEPLELRYTPEEVNRLDRENQAGRLAEQQKPDPYSLREMLRLVGTYVDGKGDLVRLSKRERMLTMQYVTERGEAKIEEHGIASFYDFAVHMYLQRGDREHL